MGYNAFSHWKILNIVKKLKQWISKIIKNKEKHLNTQEKKRSANLIFKNYDLFLYVLLQKGIEDKTELSLLSTWRNGEV